jgi:serine protease inhibitor
VSRVKIRVLFPLITLASLLAWACGDGSPLGPADEITGLPRALSLNEELLVSAGNDFSFRFLDEVYQAAPDSNLFLAPLSASMALGMTLNGAAGTTFDEMRSTLGFGSMSLDQINEGYRDLIDLLLTLDSSVEMGIGNSIWYREGFPVREDFVQRTQSYFDAEVRALDFADPGAANIINGWVKGETMGKIEEIVEDPINRETVMFLINAIYFKGSWTHRFPKEKTKAATFTSEDGATAQVPLMELEDKLLYAETQTYQAVDLPYGGKAFSMTLLLPRSNVPMQELVGSLNSAVWSQIVESLTPKEGTVHLPRFRMEWGRELNDDLKAMGMKVPFIPGQADFGGLSDDAQGLFISKVKQKTFVNVDEKGTEAAGVTSVEIGRTSIPDHFLFQADRPFLFVIRERFSETILFAGVLVESPEA